MTPSKYQLAIYDRLAAAVAARRSGGPHENLMVEAGPGGGKSHTLRTCCERVPGAKFEVVSFSSRVAKDASSRLPSNARSVTLHSVGKRAIEGLMGRRYRTREEMTEGDGELAKNKVDRIVAKLKSTGEVDQYVPVRLIARLVAHAKGVGLAPRTRDGSPVRVGRAQPQEFRGIVEDTDAEWLRLMRHFDVQYAQPTRLIAACRTTLVTSVESSTAIIDFADMTYLSACMPALRFAAADVVAVDELQDIDDVQFAMVCRMVNDSGAVFLGVGDRRQAIFGWRGAALDVMDRFARVLRCTVLPLPVCYRCPTSHLAMARVYSPSIEARPDAPVGEVAVFAGEVPDELHELLDDGGDGPPPGLTFVDGPPQPSDFRPGSAVICRTNAPLVRCAYWLMRAQVPCTLVGRDFGRGLTATLRGVGAGDAGGAVARLTERAIRSEEADRRDPTLEGAASEATARARDHADVVRAVAESLLERWRSACSDCAATTCRRHGDECVSVEAVCSEIERLFGDAGAPDAVSLMSFHRAKGGEWPRVLVLDAAAPAQRPRPGRELPPWQVAEAQNVRFVMLTRSSGWLGFAPSAAFG